MDASENVAAVRRMQAYIQDHLSEPITLHQLAAAAGYSPYHSARMFRALTGRAPFAYIRALRLTQAALALRDGSPRVVDVALDFLFDSHEGFTRAFSREFGISPHKYSAHPIPIRLFLPCEAGAGRLRKHKEESAMSVKSLPIFTQVVERPARRLLLKSGVRAEDYFAYCREEGCDIWGVLCSVKEALYEPVGMWLPDSLRPAGTSLYAQGVELPADWAGEVPEGFDLIDLAACTMMVFQGPRYDEDDFREAIGEVWTALESYDPTLYGYEWATDAAPRMQLAPMGSRGYIELRPVRKIAR